MANKPTPQPTPYPPRPEGLSAAKNRHLDVVELIFQGKSQRAAYSSVYPDASPKTAGTKCWELLKLPHAIAYRSRLHDWAAKNSEIESWQIVQELKAIAFGRPDDVIEWGKDGVWLKASAELEPSAIAQVAEVSSVEKIGPGGEILTNVKLSFHNKTQALKLLAEMNGLTNELSTAIRTLAIYGIHLKQNTSGGYYIEDSQSHQPPEITPGTHAAN
jgi:hypothetical protein